MWHLGQSHWPGNPTTLCRAAGKSWGYLVALLFLLLTIPSNDDADRDALVHNWLVVGSR